ncbi:TPA: hypothetical protein QEM96_000347 [Pseudomonas putida]|nr:hypothetical protein [Pseudomonas putida]
MNAFFIRHKPIFQALLSTTLHSKPEHPPVWRNPLPLLAGVLLVLVLMATYYQRREPRQVLEMS